MKLLAVCEMPSPQTGETARPRAEQFAAQLAHVLGAEVQTVPAEFGLIECAGADGSLLRAVHRVARDGTKVAVVIADPETTAAGSAPADATVELMQTLTVPLVLVPSGPFPVRPIRRVVVALDGDQQPSAALAPLIHALNTATTGVEVVAVHVLGADSMPVFADQTGRSVEAFRHEFCARHLGVARATVVLRTGDPATRILDVARELDADLLALAWGQVFQPGRAAVVQEAVGAGEIAVWLQPVAPVGAPTA